MINNPEILERYIRAAEEELAHTGVTCHLSAAGGDSIQIDICRHLEIRRPDVVTANLIFTVSVNLADVRVQDYVSTFVKAIREADAQLWQDIQTVEGLS